MSKDFSFSSRATVRNYDSRDIPDALIAEMVAEASHAPNTGNMQWYSVIVTRDKVLKKALAPFHFSQPQVENASAVLTFCLDLDRFERWCRLNGAEPGYENFQSLTAALIDTSIFAQQFCTIAEMHGLGTCYLGTTTYNAPQIAEVLGLPDRVVPVTTITVGYPASDVCASWRLPLEAVMHSEKYHCPTDDDIRTWYAPLEAESHHFAVENNKKTLAQVFTDIRYPKKSNEEFSGIFLSFLKKNKFL